MPDPSNAAYANARGAEASSAMTALVGWIVDILKRPATESPGLRLFFYPLRPLLIVLGALPLAFIAAFRHFGFDLADTLIAYPGNVADGWGSWAWIARQRLGFSFFFFTVNFALALLILTLTFPRQRDGYSRYWAVQITIFLYMVLWSLFGQARYGTAIGLIACALSGSSILWGFTAFVLAFLTHKAIAGGIALIFAWLFLRNRPYGVWVAASVCLAASLVISQLAEYLLVVSNYANYLNWEGHYSPAATPYKYLCIGLLLMWWLCSAKSVEGRSAAKGMLVLTLLFFPSSLYIVTAGRGYDVYIVVMLTLMFRKIVPSFVRYAIVLLCAVDIIRLVFFSQLYHPFGGG